MPCYPTHPSPSSGGDRILMLGLKSRIGNLQDGEYFHLDMVGDIRKDGRTTYETNLAILFEKFQRFCGGSTNSP
jgi:hypothetical protein